MRELLYGVFMLVLFNGGLLAEEPESKKNQGTKTSKEAKENESPAKEEVVKLPSEVVTATRLSLSLFELPYAVFRHNRDALNNEVGRTALDRIDYGPGVIMQQTAPGQTSPYIRGLTGRQSLLLFDGVRLSHATMRGGPNQYSEFIPDMSIDSIDVILGSSGVVSGSDGLTGALDFRLATPGRGVDKPFSVFVNTRVDSANGMQTATGIDGKSGNWRYTIEGSMYDFHDRVGGKDAEENIFGTGKSAYEGIPNTAYDQWAFATRVAYDGFSNRTIEFALGRTTQTDARRPDGYFENSGAASRLSRFYDPENFTYLHLRDNWTPDDSFLDKLTTTIWWHQQDEYQTREDITSSNTVYRRRDNDDRTNSLGLESQATSQIGNHEVTYGAFFLFESTSNEYREFRNTAGIESAGATEYKPEGWSKSTTITDGAKYNTYALYAQDLWQINDKWSLLAGLRFTYVDWDFDVADNNVSDVTGSLRGSWHFREDMLAFLGISKSFRAPNLTDLDGASDRASSGTITFGNPDLDPEIGYTFESGWRYTKEKNLFSATIFYTILEDVIQTVYAPGNTTGKSGNGESAYLRGFELEWDYGLPVPFGNRFSLVGSISYVDSESDVPQADGSILKEPISRANRLYGKAGLRYEINSNWWAKAQVRFHDSYDEGDIFQRGRNGCSSHCAWKC
jgi:outer membrane receptor protein involved in Fe transport